MIEPSYRLNGKLSTKEEIDNVKEAVHKKTVKIHVEYYETPEYTKQEQIASMKFFDRLQDDREELEKRHG